MIGESFWKNVRMFHRFCGIFPILWKIFLDENWFLVHFFSFKFEFEFTQTFDFFGEICRKILIFRLFSVLYKVLSPLKAIKGPFKYNAMWNFWFSDPHPPLKWIFSVFLIKSRTESLTFPQASLLIDKFSFKKFPTNSISTLSNSR